MHPLEDYQLNGGNEAGASNLILRAREIYVDQEASLLFNKQRTFQSLFLEINHKIE